MTERTQSDLVAEIIKLIRPDPGCEARCREKIGESIILIEKTDKDERMASGGGGGQRQGSNEGITQRVREG